MNSSVAAESSAGVRSLGIHAPHIPLTSAVASDAHRDHAAIAAYGLKKQFRKAATNIPVLQGVDLQVTSGQMLAIVGQSGSGKSTLLHLLGTLDQPDAGQIFLDGRRIDHLPAGNRDRLRSGPIGMVFQFYHLLPELSALENVLLPGLIRHSLWTYTRHRRQLRQRASDLLDQVGLGHRANHRPRELSGGEMQRVAIARALVNRPTVLLADEPTGNLDRRTGEEIVALLRRLNAQHGLTIVMVTHDERLAQRADATVRLFEGRVQSV